MKPNFALSLSFEGISLLHRAFPGWNRVGEVALDSPDLAGALAVLRDTAEQIGGADIASKLVIPNDQVKYLSLDLGIMTEDERHAAVHSALDGATPYPVDDLAFDWSVEGDRTLVAAVARETLSEAESFATSHGFAPVSFVAIPTPEQFSGEPFFGQTAGAADLLPDGEQVQRDLAAIRITGVARLPDPGDTADDVEPEVADAASGDEPVSAPESAPESALIEPADEAATAPPAADSADPAPADAVQDAPPPVRDRAPLSVDDLIQAAPAPAPAPAPDGDPAPGNDAPEIDDTADPALAADPAPADGPALDPLPVFGHSRDADLAPDAPEPPAPEPHVTSEIIPDDAPEDGDTDDTALDLPAEPQPVADEPDEIVPAFSTMRAQRQDDLADVAAPVLGGMTRGADGLTAPSIPVPMVDLPPVEEGDDVDSADTPPHPAMPVSQDMPTDPSVLDDVASLPDLRQNPNAEPGFDPHYGEDAFDDEYSRFDDPNAPAAPDLVAPRETRLAVLGRRGTAMAAGLAGGMRASLAARSDRRADGSDSAQQAEELTEQPATADRETERQRMTVFGARKPEKQSRDVGGKPRFLGLILSVVLLLFLAGVAAWASIFMDDGLSRFFGGPRDTRLVAVPDTTIDELALEGEEAMVPTPPEDQTETAALEQPAPAAEQPETPPVRLQPTLPHALTEKEAQARYAVTGVWQRAPQEPQLPDAQTLDDLYVASIDPRVDAQDAVALPSLSLLSTDVAMARVPLPAARGARFDFDDRGLVVARAQGALSPEGFLVFAGRPARVPPAVPQALANAAPEAAADPARARLAAVRPKSRPGGIVEANERSNLGGLTRQELAGKRPKLRPVHPDDTPKPANDAATPPAQDTQTADATTDAQTPETTVVPGTEFAVSTSRKPKPRPSNFAKLVKRARNAAKTSEPAETTRLAAAVPRQQAVKPAAPSKTSVAKAATVRNQINLRKINLIGVYGKPNSRRALVRLSNGRYKKVKVGDRLDGGRVSSIGDGDLRYTKNGRNVILKMPRG